MIIMLECLLVISGKSLFVKPHLSSRLYVFFFVTMGTHFQVLCSVSAPFTFK